MNDAEHGLTVQLRTNGHLNGEWRYATPEEIMAAHPTCDTCANWTLLHINTIDMVKTGQCGDIKGNETNSISYCCQWEPKESER